MQSSRSTKTQEFISIYKLAKAGKIKYQALAKAFTKFDDLLRSVKVTVVEWTQVNPGRRLGEGATAVVFSSELQLQGNVEKTSRPSKKRFAVKLLKGDEEDTAPRNDVSRESRFN